MSDSRRARAFALAPLVVPLLQLPVVLLGHVPFPWSLVAIILAAIVGYVGTFAFAVPAYRLLTIAGSPGASIAAAVGFAAGALMWLLFSLLFVLSLGQGSAGVHRALTDFNNLRGCIWPGGVSGACVGLAFWRIAAREQ